MPMGQLTDAELSEYEELKRNRDQSNKDAEEAAAKDVPPTPTYYLHLADGSIIESAGTMTHYKGQVVMQSVPMEASTR